jgi:SAM-dependent methyltransferase
MVYQDPLAYLLGVEGTALLRAFAGEYDRDFTQARLTEIRCLLDHPALAAEGVSAGLVSTEDGYGTGRHSAHLVELGHRVIGVDSSPDMLDRARERVPQAEFITGELHQLPFPDDHFDLAVCSLALTHVRDLGPRPLGRLALDAAGPRPGRRRSRPQRDAGRDHLALPADLMASSQAAVDLNSRTSHR